MLGLFKKKKPVDPPRGPTIQFPPVPDWKPAILQPLEKVEDRVRYYTNGNKDFALFQHGTFALLPGGLTDAQAEALALESLHNVFHAHPDMHPVAMDDGNILVGYKHNVGNVVLSDIVSDNWAEIESNHQGALATHEVLITPLVTTSSTLSASKRSLVGATCS